MAPSGGWLIDELARAGGVTARNVRAYQSMGLLVGPRLLGRVGRYGAEHLDRVRAIRRLQARGFSLAGIRELLDAHDRGQTLEAVLGLEGPSAPASLPVDAPRFPRLALLPGPWAQALGTSRPAATN